MKESTMEMLEKYGQTHLLEYYNVLDDQARKSMDYQLAKLDWHLLDLLEHPEERQKRGEIAPIGALSIEEIREHASEYTQEGLAAIRAGKVGALLLAGGQGTRLGCQGPKGVYNIGETHELYIFELLFKNTLDVVRQAGDWIPFFIMTSDRNHNETVLFLNEHHFFGYNPDYVFFFKQEMAPAVDFNHKLLMEKPDRLALSPNGNGDWFSSFAHAGLLERAKKMGIEWLNAFAVDNVLQRIADPCFIGAVIRNGCVSGAKVVRKADPEERVGALCLEDGKPSIIEYYEMTHEMNYAKGEDGKYLYSYGVILNYLFRLDRLEAIADAYLPIHMVEKKIPYIDPDGICHSPETPNGYKFETLILDMVHLMDNCLAYEVEREREFAPVKNKEGIDSVETARELLKKNGVEL